MPELIWIVDPTTGDLTVEGLDVEKALALASDLLPPPRELNCAQPLTSTPLPIAIASDEPTLRVAALWHGSVIEGPGRRSVLQVQGCPLRCSVECAVPQTHSFTAGTELTVDVLVEALLDPIGAPRDGVTILGGEPMAQADGLEALLRRLKARGTHTVVYTGYTLEALARRADPAVGLALEHANVLIDGPYLPALSDAAGEWRGSRNQRVIFYPATALAQLTR